MWLTAPEAIGEIVSVSHGDQQYPVVDGVVEVPDKAIADILVGMGFVLSGEPTSKAPSGGDGFAGPDKPKPLRLKGKR